MDQQEYILSYLEYFRRLGKRRAYQEQWLLTLTVVVVFLLLAGSLRLFFLTLPILLVTVRAFLCLAGLIVCWRFLKAHRWWSKQSYLDLARRVEKKFQSLNNHLINAYQLSQQKRYPDCLVQRQREKTVTLLAAHEVEKAVEAGKVDAYRKVVVFATILLVIGLLLRPGHFLSGWRILFSPSFTWDFSVLVEPGDCSVEPGTEITIRTTWPETEDTPKVEINTGEVKRFLMTKEGNGYSFFLGPVNQPVIYRIVGPHQVTRWFRLSLKEKTGLRKVKVIHEYPSYTRLGKKLEEGGLGPITTLRFTKLTLQVDFSRPVGETSLILGNGQVFTSRGRSPTKIFTFLATDSTLFEFQYYDLALRQVLRSSREKLSLSFDQAPFLTFTKPGRDLVARLPATLPIEIVASDDYGLGMVTLRYHQGEGELSRSDPVVFQMELKGKKSATSRSQKRVS
ncbi:MAG: hypothetical protein NC911_08055 [Candidatus Omnitrophica bacterium]|nr:hypothetical protein [Candidatus Omnitrophota bacterium]